MFSIVYSTCTSVISLCISKLDISSFIEYTTGNSSGLGPNQSYAFNKVIIAPVMVIASEITANELADVITSSSLQKPNNFKAMKCASVQLQTPTRV
jgi:hypothetical protein|tara:strand:- start:375 stop:662 length:288 start_codon:yes stop_codon:yes gene_type:complete